MPFPYVVLLRSEDFPPPSAFGAGIGCNHTIVAFFLPEEEEDEEGKGGGGGEDILEVWGICFGAV